MFVPVGSANTTGKCTSSRNRAAPRRRSPSHADGRAGRIGKHENARPVTRHSQSRRRWSTGRGAVAGSPPRYCSIVVRPRRTYEDAGSARKTMRAHDKRLQVEGAQVVMTPSRTLAAPSADGKRIAIGEQAHGVALVVDARHSQCPAPQKSRPLDASIDLAAAFAPLCLCIPPSKWAGSHSQSAFGG